MPELVEALRAREQALEQNKEELWATLNQCIGALEETRLWLAAAEQAEAQAADSGDA